MHVRTCLFLQTATLIVAGCVGPTKVINVDLASRQGVYVVGFTIAADVRTTLENLLVTDLAAQSIIARASHLDISNIVQSTREQVIAEANSRDILAVLVINQVAADASDSVTSRSSAASCTSRCRRAAALSAENDHS